jgi:hypothetical protein
MRGPLQFLVKAMDCDESYCNSIVLTILKNELTINALVPLHVWTCKHIANMNRWLQIMFGKHGPSAYNVASG